MAGAIPHAFMCPITCDVMDRPVVAADGHSYELEAITQWLESHSTSPLTNARLHTTVLIPNVALRKAIDEWRAAQPMPIDPERLELADPEEVIGEGSFGRVVAGLLATRQGAASGREDPPRPDAEGSARAVRTRAPGAHHGAAGMSMLALASARSPPSIPVARRAWPTSMACCRERTGCAVCLARAKKATGCASL